MGRNYHQDTVHLKAPYRNTLYMSKLSIVIKIMIPTRDVLYLGINSNCNKTYFFQSRHKNVCLYIRINYYI